MNNNNPVYMTKRIGGSTYKVKIYFGGGNAETMEEKILRLISNHPLANDKSCDTISVSQMSRSA